MDKETIVQLLADGVISNEVAAKYFPELKENEDEKVKKELIYTINLAYDCGIAITKENRDKYLAWLEKQGEQKPFWSEEDEKKIAYLIALLQNSTMHNSALSAANEGLEDWLKSLKERIQIQPKQEWSEEDEKALGDALWCCKQAASIAKDENDMGNAWYAENWLKSLRPQNTWKPSESDILLLERMANGKSDPQDFQASLYALIGQLKKLKGE